MGHGGTLDPFSTGLLILLVGKSTRLAHLFQGRTEDARQRFEELLPTMKQALGPDHPHTLETIRELDGIRKSHE